MTTMTKAELLRSALPGDLIGLSRGGFVGHTIRTAAKLSSPKVPYRKTWSHVGIVYYPRDGKPTLLESTTMNTSPDLATGAMRNGVSLVDLGDRLDTVKGRVWWRPMLRMSPERANDVSKTWYGLIDPDEFSWAYRQVMGVSYENLHSVSGLWNMVDASLFDWMHIGDESKENRRLFCSEMVAHVAKVLFTDRFVCPRPSQVEPTDLAVKWNNIWAEAWEVE